MIFDTIQNLSQYKGIPRLDSLIGFIESHDIAALPEGRTDIDGDNLYVMIQTYTTKDPSEARPEAHDRYIDLQYMLEGKEYIGYAERSSLGAPAESFPERDISFFSGETCKMLLTAGTFGIYFPGDIHAPCIAAEDPTPVRKAVFKIRCAVS